MISASDIISIKSRIKAECTRRNNTGSVESYAGTDYDYSTDPVTGEIIDAEDKGKKTATPIIAITGSFGVITDTANIKPGEPIPDELNTLGDILTTLEGYSKYGSSTGCASSCTGLCHSSCYGTCSSCSYGCSYCGGSCSYGCGSGCGDGCTGSCGDGCTSCTGGCTSCDSCASKGTCAGNCGTDSTNKTSCSNCYGSCQNTNTL